MKQSHILALALTVPVALAAGGCAILAGLEQYDTPAVSAAVGAVNNDGLTLARDTAQANADRAAHPAAVPGDLARISADATELAADRAALLAAIATAKAAGASVTPVASAAAGTSQ